MLLFDLLKILLELLIKILKKKKKYKPGNLNYLSLEKKILLSHFIIKKNKLFLINIRMIIFLFKLY